MIKTYLIKIMSNDALSDVLTQIRNAILVKKSSVLIPNTKINYQISRILEDEGFIQLVTAYALSSKYLMLYFKYKGRKKKPVLSNLRRISKPGRRIYANYKEIPTILGGLGIIILSTSRGILTDSEARSYRVGGEVLCSIW